MKINSKHYILVLLAVASVVLTGFGYLFVHSMVVSQAENYSKALQEVESEKGRVDREQGLAKTHADTVAQRARLPGFIISEDKLVDFIESVESAASASGSEITLTSITTEESHLKGNVEVKGSWQSVMRALILIENLPYSISLDKMRLAFAEKKWDLTFEIKALTTQ